MLTIGYTFLSSSKEQLSRHCIHCNLVFNLVFSWYFVSRIAQRDDMSWKILIWIASLSNMQIILCIVISHSKHTYCIFKAANLYIVSWSWYSSHLWSDSHQSSGRHVVHFEAPHTDLYCTHNLPLQTLTHDRRQQKHIKMWQGINVHTLKPWYFYT